VRKTMRVWRMMRHVPLPQLASRFRLQIQRRAEVRLHAAQRKRIPLSGKALSEILPLPIFPPRRGKIELTEDHAVFRFLGTEETTARPIEWRATKHQYGTRLWLLNLHYMEYLEELDDRECLDLIDEWIRMNPPYQPGFWLDNWNSFSLSIRVVVWMQQIALRQRGPETRSSIVDSLMAQLLFLEDHLETDIGGNQLIKNIKALLWGGRFFAGEDARRWSSKGDALLRKELQRQILNDGMHFELTPAYHRQVFADLLEVRSVLADGSVKSELDSVLNRMACALVLLIHPDGELAQFGDTSLDSDYLPTDLLRYWAGLSGWKDLKSGAWNLSDSGFAGHRHDGSYFIVRAGRMAADELPAHGHGDVGSFEWSVKGRRMVIDTGVYEYNEGQRRRWSRSTEAHNTVTLDLADQAEFWGSFRVGRRPRVQRTREVIGTALELSFIHDGFARMDGAPVHRRDIVFSPGDLVVKDEVTGGGSEVRAHITLHPEVVMKREGSVWKLISDGSAMVLETNAEVSVREVEWYPTFGRVRKTNQILLKYGVAPLVGHFRLRVT